MARVYPLHTPNQVRQQCILVVLLIVCVVSCVLCVLWARLLESPRNLFAGIVVASHFSSTQKIIVFSLFTSMGTGVFYTRTSTSKYDVFVYIPSSGFQTLVSVENVEKKVSKRRITLTFLILQEQSYE